MIKHLHCLNAHRDAAIVSVLTAFVGTFAFSLFILHSDSVQISHGFDVTAPLLFERIIALLHSIGE